MMYSQAYEAAREKARALLSKMTLTEKIGQLSQFGTSIYSDNEQRFEDHFSEGKVGSYLTIKGAGKTNGIQKDLLKATRTPIPALFADDVIHGYRTTFPTPLAQRSYCVRVYSTVTLLARFRGLSTSRPRATLV